MYLEKEGNLVKPDIALPHRTPHLLISNLHFITFSKQTISVFFALAVLCCFCRGNAAVTVRPARPVRPWFSAMPRGAAMSALTLLFILRKCYICLFGRREANKQNLLSIVHTSCSVWSVDVVYDSAAAPVHCAGKQSVAVRLTLIGNYLIIW